MTGAIVDPDEEYFMTNYSKASTTISQNTFDGTSSEVDESTTVSSFGGFMDKE